METKELKQAVIKQLSKHKNEAKTLLKSPVKTFNMLRKAGKKGSKIDVGSFRELQADFFLMLELAKAYVKREYRAVPVRTILAVLGAALYVLNPIDIIPDVIPVVGFLDDAFVIGFVLKQIRSDLEAFKDWRAGAEAIYVEDELEEITWEDDYDPDVEIID